MSSFCAANSVGDLRQVAYARSMRGRALLLQGDLQAATEALDRSVALAQQGWTAFPPWPQALRAVEIFVDAIARCLRLPDTYLWGKGYALDALCGLAVAQDMPQAPAWIDELQSLAACAGMRELTVRAHPHRGALGDTDSGAAARLLAGEVDNPVLLVAEATPVP